MSFNLRWVVIALLIATFIIVPVADASLCTFGTNMHSHSELNGHADHPSFQQNHNSGQEQNHTDSQGLCNFAHCHHSAVHFPPSPSGTTESSRLIHQWPEDIPVQILVAEQLIRPPKA